MKKQRAEGFSVKWEPPIMARIGAHFSIDKHSIDLSISLCPLMELDLELYWPWAKWLRGPLASIEVLGLSFEYDGLTDHLCEEEHGGG